LTKYTILQGVSINLRLNTLWCLIERRVGKAGVDEKFLKIYWVVIRISWVQKIKKLISGGGGVGEGVTSIRHQRVNETINYANDEICYGML